MAFFLDTQETVQRFGKSVEEFRSLLDTNHVRNGSPNDLFEFARTLEHSNQFRNDLSALVKSVMKREGGELLLTDMVSIIATSVGGPSFADTRMDLTKPTNALMEFLLGTGCWRQFGAPSRQVAAPQSPTRNEEPSPIPIASSRSASAASSASTACESASLLDLSNELRQTLSRLESNTLEVKQHLESIEQRISKVEPVAELPPARTAVGLEPLIHAKTSDDVHRKAADPVISPVVPQPADEVTPIFGGRPLAPSRAVFSHPPLPDQIESDEDNDFTAPTFAYGTERGRSLIPVAVFLVLVAIVAGVLFFLHSGRGKAMLDAGMARLNAVRTHSAGAVAPAPTPPAENQVPAATPTSPPASSSSSATQAPSSQIAAQPAADKTQAAPANSGASADDNGAQPDVASETSTPNSFKGRYVQSNVMEGYLLSAPRPEYPARARMDHIQGQVAIQVTISRHGSIQTMHVIKGPSALRSAAIDAVRTWRYRPYMVEGRPEDVATTVYVDFNLNPPPAIVH